MSFRYTHTLIAISPTFTPSASQVESFLAVMLSGGAVGGETTMTLLMPSTRTRQARNPFTGEVQEIPVMDRKPVASTTEIANAIGKLRDYRMGVSGTGRPTRPPLPLDFDEPYHLGITCIVSSMLRSTSDLHDESGGPAGVPFHGEPIVGRPKVGYFSNPHSMEVIQVPGGGCARF